MPMHCFPQEFLLLHSQMIRKLNSYIEGGDGGICCISLTWIISKMLFYF